ncbi:hypothetical protein [Streptomyces sp. NPDC001100]
MMITIISGAMGLAGATATHLVTRNRVGRERVRLGLAAGLTSVLLLTVWAVWRNQFPATFAPFVLIMLWTGIARSRKQPEEGSNPAAL